MTACQGGETQRIRLLPERLLNEPLARVRNLITQRGSASIPRSSIARHPSTMPPDRSPIPTGEQPDRGQQHDRHALRGLQHGQGQQRPREKTVSLFPGQDGQRQSPPESRRRGRRSAASGRQVQRIGRKTITGKNIRPGTRLPPGESGASKRQARSEHWDASCQRKVGRR